ncbi:MAG: adenosine deaminase [Levilactobacillus sp.]|jgi:adenosine deaminase|uniref:adenosine deaminase n=1 Tax=Levilactobacillus suantsaiihabitans TaxID=2487722 RepID=A0A4Z0J8B3_9LACO|nr:MULTISPECIES: adenosine deaminase [Levilactobacillus]MCI1553451.1 adenosine deaminase [Levilactobacillus sp.]MCI1597840.1 adenosine deaminase [Levilactobacillus sp.]MCI1605638.1 adenosine deaminase [Levilactobacillus sp.]TGD17657.1 adenosine deaminase [Levilactobacillus suantsaiihabitans]
MSHVKPFTQENVQHYPKVELHCHLDGSLSRDALRQMAAVTGAELPASDAELHDLTSAPLETESLIQYLKRFQVVTDLMQTPEQLRIAGRDMVATAAKDGLIYLEARFAPQISTAQGLSVKEVIAALLDGLHAGTREFGVPVNAIVCAMRDRPLDECINVFQTAAEFADQGVVGLDFAGDEYNHPAIDLAPAVKAGLATGLPFTLHAGEAGPVDNVAVSLTMGAKRIGHGVHMSGFPATIAQAKRAGATIEMCPTSNVQTKAVDGYANFPLAEFLSAGLKVTLNTDDRTVSDVTLTSEIMKMHDQFGLDWSLLKKLTLNAIDGAFIPEAQKAQLRAKVQAAETVTA